MLCDIVYRVGPIRTVQRAIASAILVTLLVATCSSASDHLPYVPFRVEHDKYFQPFRLTLQKFIDKKSRYRRNHICVLGERSSEHWEEAWVYWKEGKSIMLWEPTKDSGIIDLSLSRRYIHIDRIDDSADGLYTSTYLSSHAWAEDLIKKCKAFGTNIVLIRGEGRG